MYEYFNEWIILEDTSLTEYMLDVVHTFYLYFAYESHMNTLYRVLYERLSNIILLLNEFVKRF